MLTSHQTQDTTATFQALADKLPRYKDWAGKPVADTPDSVGPRMAHDRSRANDWRAWGLIHKGKPAGRVVWYYGPGGGVTCTISAHAGPLSVMPIITGNAGGGGYCKTSASFADALHRAGIKPESDIAGRGEGVVIQYLESLGYDHVDAM